MEISSLSFRRLLWGLATVALFLRWPVPGPGWQHFDESSFIVLPLGFWGGDLNPHFFNYPTLHFYLVSVAYLVYYAAGWTLGLFGSMQAFVADRAFVDGSDLLAITRGLNSLLSALTVLTVGFLGQRLRGPTCGLLAAGFLAVMPLSVRFAHLANTDTPAVLWVAVALLWAVRARQEDTGFDFALAGVSVGMAAATKYPAAAVAVPVAAAWLRGAEVPSRRQVALAAGAAAATFAVATPFVWLSPLEFWRDFSSMSGTHLLADSESTSTLWAHAATLQFAVGWLGLAAIVAGLVSGGWPPTWQQAMIVAGLAAIAAPLLVAKSTFMRYALPLTPLLAVLVAQGAELAARRRRWLLAVAVPLLAAEPLYASLATRSLLSGDDTREQATAWLLAQAPQGGRVLEPDSECGRVDLLTPPLVLVHLAHFMRSYDVDAALRAFHHLGQRTDLPPLFLGREGSESTPPQAGALWLRYDHPICSQAETAPGTTEAMFSPGAEGQARYDLMDWFFLPVSGFGHTEATGPRIEVGRVASPDGQGRPPLTASAFFHGMAWITEAHQAAAEGREREAQYWFGRLVAAWPPPETVVGATMAARLYGQVGRLNLSLGKVAAAIPPLERAAVLHPGSTETVHALATACAAAGQLQRAAGLWRQVIEADPAFSGAYRNLARVLTDLGRTEEARQVAERGRAAAGESP
jgi:hypothetical protein